MISQSSTSKEDESHFRVLGNPARDSYFKSDALVVADSFARASNIQNATSEPHLCAVRIIASHEILEKLRMADPRTG